ncbi:hypothetical protein LJY25_10295 [Hymenobacter sp. BT175]|uniref:hypothetical protein n=1 Tax=Hymenobacter translucens TaxID=2886507 RepID=UPI001D0EF9E1|nr:hypothetical protein [Hymenobacter translucens]MCC2546834.1 hypothetical protein [Hymenobacter translucens]
MTGRRLQTLPLVDFNIKAANKELQLLNLLKEDDTSTQNQISKQLYNKKQGDSVAFRKLKSRVEHKLLNHLYFLDHTDPRHSVSRRFELQCLELFHQSSVLQWESEYSLAERLLRKCLRLAQEGEFTRYIVLALNELRDLYAEKREPARYRATMEQLKHYRQVQEWEEEASQLYWDTKMIMIRSVKLRSTLLDDLPGYIQKLQHLHEKARTFSTFYYHYRMQITREEMVGNFDEIIRITSAVEEQLAAGKINKKRFDSRYNKFMNIYALLRNRQAQKGLELAEGYFKDFHPSSGNWFYFLEHYLLLALHAGQYSQAHELMRLAHKNTYYSKQRVAALQRWDLYEAYLHFISPEASSLRLMHFAQFVQTVPDYSRDKQGYNVAILILQFLYYLRRNDEEALLMRLESLRKYEQRWLRDPATLRSQLFLRLLVLTVKENFRAEVCEKKGQTLLARLQGAPQPGEAYAETEIIPYEDLWALTLTILRNHTAEPAGARNKLNGE